MQNIVNIKSTCKLFKKLNLPHIEIPNEMMDLIDEELSYILLWDTIEFGFKTADTQLRKLWYSQMIEDCYDDMLV